MISESLSRLGAIIDRLEQSGEEYTSTRVVEAYRQTDDDEGKLCVFARKVTDHLRRCAASARCASRRPTPPR